MKTVIKLLFGLGMLALVACSNKGDDPIYTDFQSCVDFGQGCNQGIYQTFQAAGALQPYRTENGVLVGAQQVQGGLVYYQNFDGCENNSTIQTQNNGMIKRFIPVVLPRNGGLACLDSNALVDPSYGYDPRNSGWYIPIEVFDFSELHMYGYRHGDNNNLGWGGNGNTNYENHNFMTKRISTGTYSGGNNQQYYYNRDLSFYQANSGSAELLVGCDLRAGQEGNPECATQWQGQGTCSTISSYYADTGWFGLCTR